MPRTELSLPPLPLQAWRDTRDTLHMWMQIVGKIALATTPLTNHFWNAAFHLTPRGLETQPLHAGRTFVIAFDFVADRLRVICDDGSEAEIALEPCAVAELHRRLKAALHGLGIDVHIWTMPVEVQDPVRFETDVVHRAYDAAAAHDFWRILTAVAPVFEAARASFVGKASPVHFFWGSFDLAFTRFSGRRAPPRPSDDAITREAYSHEQISQGFWPGGPGFDDAAFYAYAYPEPAGFRAAPILPRAAFYSDALHELILPYEAMRTSSSPLETLRTFLDTSYAAGADLLHWDRHELERSL